MRERGLDFAQQMPGKTHRPGLFGQDKEASEPDNWKSAPAIYHCTFIKFEGSQETDENKKKRQRYAEFKPLICVKFQKHFTSL